VYQPNQSDGNNTGNVTKADVEAGTDAVTRADMLAQEIIEGSLRHHFKGLHVVGEEDIDEKDYQVREYAEI
jgi:fructose-1,6-bisphosphatase/inositol monophosphatase family enzyme